jgi:hypothetical protein
MAKKQTRRSISVSRTTYERLKAFCEANNISMSQLVETRVNDFLGEGGAVSVNITGITGITPRPPAPTMPGTAPRPSTGSSPSGISPSGSSSGNPTKSAIYGEQPAPSQARPSTQPIPMTSAAARFAVDPPPPILKPKQPDTNAPKPAEKRPDQIFTF